MKYILQFSIGLSDDRNQPGDICVSSEDDFATFRQLFPGETPPKNPRVYNVTINDWNKTYLEAFQALKKCTGREPVADLLYAHHHSESHFPVVIQRHPTREELLRITWLYLIPPANELATFNGVNQSGSFIVRGAGRKRKALYGYARHEGWCFLFKDTLKAQLLASGLHEIEFRPVQLTSGEPSGLWQIWSSVTMPPLAMPFLGDLEHGSGIDDGAYRPQVLRYEEHTVSDLANVDVALSTERLGIARNWHRRVIVSQRFRQVAEALAPGQFKFGLVAVGHGEELKRRFTLPELAPPLR